MKTRTAAAAGVAGVVGLGIGIGFLTADRNPSSPTAPATYYVSVTGSDTAACTVAAPCKTIDKGYRKATACSDKVEVLPGVYPKQTVAQDTTKNGWANGCHVIIYGGEYYGLGADPILKGLTVNGDHMELIHLDGEDVNCVTTQIEPAGCVALVLSGAVDVQFAYSTGFARFFIYGGDQQSIGAADFGPSYDNHGIIGFGAPVSNLTITNVTIHDQVHSTACVNTPGCWGLHHMTCLNVNAGTGITIMISRIERCDDTLLFKATNTGLNGVTVENSYVNAGGFGSIKLNPNGNTFANIDIRWTTLGGPLLLDPGSTLGTGSEFKYNLGPSPSCTALANGGFATGYNVSTGTACGTNSLSNVASLGLAADGYHLLATSPAKDLVPSSEPHPPNDIDFTWVRPTGPALDAGADEYVP